MNKKTPDQKDLIEGRVVAPRKATDLSRRAQQRRIMHRLNSCGYVTTQQARNELEVMHPAGRVRELKRQGVEIVTVMVPEPSICGVVHRVGKYILMVPDAAQKGPQGDCSEGDDE